VALLSNPAQPADPKTKKAEREGKHRLPNLRSAPLYFFAQVSYAWRKEKSMEMRYTYETDGKFLVGYLDEYPEHPTQAFSIEELEENLKDIFALIQDGTLEAKNTAYYNWHEQTRIFKQIIRKRHFFFLSWHKA
jgi:predicted RNase H-like HicB family nuclease